MQTAPKKVINAWAMYDWANSAYNLVITSTIFPAYYDAITSVKNAEANSAASPATVAKGRGRNDLRWFAEDCSLTSEFTSRCGKGRFEPKHIEYQCDRDYPAKNQ